MAEIIPFQGILYNTEKIKKISDVVTPPYDVISVKERDAFYERHPNSVVRLDKGKATETDTDQDNPHTRAAAYFQNWLKDKILVEDSDPALYLTAVEFNVSDKPVTRFGLIARVRLEPFDKGIVLPHEKTFSKVKTERLELIKACHANFSQIFSIFSDQTNILGLLTSCVENMAPVFDFKDDAGHRHQLWRITDPLIHQKVSDAFKEKKLFIADGHHRYETALNYRKWLIENNSEFTSDHPANYTMMYLCSIQDPGLVILPTHRLLTTILKETRDSFLQKAETFFDIEKHSFDPSDPISTQQQLHQEMAITPGKHKFGVFIKNRPEYYILKLKPGVMDNVFGSEIEAPLKKLDVIVLTRLIFVKLLGFDDDMLDDHDLINFTSKEINAITAATTGTHDMAFILNPTTNEQVTRIAEKGLIMPRKSTYYFPKAISGQVMRSLTP
ncbi:MAG: DUF1015 domain-containing protein [Desulfobacteraceae bacterium]|nr:DUF1015 domain-containing protein [Desulfobacteraceae bacterium]MBC2755264.1 DUF1015 domain-containing protein [Desulfobacteraceae bacterium]